MPLCWPMSVATVPSTPRMLDLAEQVEREPWLRHEQCPFRQAFRQLNARGHDDVDVRVALRGKMRELHAVNLAGQINVGEYHRHTSVHLLQHAQRPSALWH